MSIDDFADTPTIELIKEIEVTQKKARRLDKDPGTRATMLASATAVRLASMRAQLALRDDLYEVNQQLATTRENIEVTPGQVWADLDPRMAHRKVTILAVEHGRARVQDNIGRITTIAVRRMHKHSTGFTRVK